MDSKKTLIVIVGESGYGNSGYADFATENGYCDFKLFNATISISAHLLAEFTNLQLRKMSFDVLLAWDKDVEASVAGRDMLEMLGRRYVKIMFHPTIFRLENLGRSPSLVKVDIDFGQLKI